MIDLKNIIKNRPCEAGKWEGIVLAMQPHTQGLSPLDLFQKRQPNESSDPVALKYRLDNHRSVTKDDFDIAIEQYQAAAKKVDYYEEIPEKTKQYISDLRLYDGFNSCTIKDWVINFVGRYKQTDPNAFVVVLPMHPNEELITSYDAELPNFDNIQNLSVKPIPYLVKSSEIKFIAENEFVFEFGEWVINEDGDTRPFYFHFESEQISLIYPSETVSDSITKVEYISYPWYSTRRKWIDTYVIGTRIVVEEDKIYYLPDYWGAAQWGNQALCQLSDLQICEKRFTYPEKVIVAKECEEIGEYINGIHHIIDDHGNSVICGVCKGKGYIIDSSPLGVHIVRKGSGMNDQGEIIDPVKYVSPDTAILEHSAKRVDAYYLSMMDKLFITRQNMTNQSGESKMYDSEQKRNVNSNIVRGLYSLYENIIKSIAALLNENPNDVKIVLPDEIDVINANDALVELQEAKQKGVSYPIVVEKTKQHLLKVIGKTPENIALVDFIAKKDRLFGYSTAEVKDAVAIFGSGITDRDKAIHFFGYTVLKDWLNKAENKDKEITDELFDSLIAPYIVRTNTL